jgi:hypothetical protein
MRDSPAGADLLNVARAVLRDELLGALPADKRHTALMIANAMSIAERQIRQGDEPERRELVSLHALIGRPCGEPSPSASDLRVALMQANRELARRIRCGIADPGTPMNVPALAHLKSVLRQRALESNPKALPKDAQTT